MAAEEETATGKDGAAAEATNAEIRVGGEAFRHAGEGLVDRRELEVGMLHRLFGDVRTLLRLDLRLRREGQKQSEDRKKEKNIVHDGNVTLEQVYEAARVMRPRSMAKEFKGTVKEILGTAVSVGCTVEGEDPRDVQKQIDDGTLVPPDE